MRPITAIAHSTTSTGTIQVWLAAAVVACTLVAGCGQSPTSPATSTASPGNTTSVAASGPSDAQATAQSWQDFQARGWNCRTPAPTVAVCSPPGQPLPAVAIPPAQPPADRPPTVMLKRWINDVFNANVLLIRPEIYNGQPCASTGLPYTLIAVLGYFECAHLVGS